MNNIKGLATLLKEAGATRVLLIGGAVIDQIFNRPVKDWDLEVYGLTYNQIVSALTKAGLPANVVGKEFGIVKTAWDGFDIDLNIPRRDNRIGKGHRGFLSELDPNMTPKEAGRRRDLTMNSMYQDIETGEIIDPFGGLEDLKSGIVRATDLSTFIEDPLRALRIMQLLPRKGKIVDQSTMELCRSMVDEYSTLAKERVFEEFVKLLMKAPKPSVGLKFLVDSGWIIHFPELEAMIGCYQNPEWHPEGDVWEHTLRVVDFAAVAKEYIPEDWQLTFMFGALCHDIGKPLTTDSEGKSPGHDIAGVPVAEKFMRRITNDKDIINKVLIIIETHMRPGQLLHQEAGIPAWKRLHNKIRLDVVGYMSYCDSVSRFTDEPNFEELHEPSRMALKFFKEFGVSRIKPILTGKDLIAAGIAEGPEIGQRLSVAYEAQLDGITDRGALLNIALRQ